MSRPTRPTSSTRKWPPYNEGLKRRASLTVWFEQEMAWEAARTGMRGRQNTRPWKADGAGAIARNEALRALRRFGRTIWRRCSGHHRRSRAETKTRFIKLVGQRLTARDFDRQVAAFQLRVAVPNGFTTFGIPLTEAVG